MKLFHLSWLLGMLSYIILGVLRRSASPLAETALGTQRSVTILLVLLPAGIGVILGVMSWNRKEVKAWWVTGVILLNIVMALAGIVHLII